MDKAATFVLKETLQIRTRLLAHFSGDLVAPHAEQAEPRPDPASSPLVNIYIMYITLLLFFYFYFFMSLK